MESVRKCLEEDERTYGYVHCTVRHLLYGGRLTSSGTPIVPLKHLEQLGARPGFSLRGVLLGAAQGERRPRSSQ